MLVAELLQALSRHPEKVGDDTNAIHELDVAEVLLLLLRTVLRTLSQPMRPSTLAMLVAELLQALSRHPEKIGDDTNAIHEHALDVAKVLLLLLRTVLRTLSQPMKPSTLAMLVAELLQALPRHPDKFGDDPTQSMNLRLPTLPKYFSCFSRTVLRTLPPPMRPSTLAMLVAELLQALSRHPEKFGDDPPQSMNLRLPTLPKYFSCFSRTVLRTLLPPMRPSTLALLVAELLQALSRHPEKFGDDPAQTMNMRLPTLPKYFSCFLRTVLRTLPPPMRPSTLAVLVAELLQALSRHPEKIGDDPTQSMNLRLSTLPKYFSCFSRTVLRTLSQILEHLALLLLELLHLRCCDAPRHGNGVRRSRAAGSCRIPKHLELEPERREKREE